MICAVLFDLDGTLVQTEELKARSYADAARQLDPAVAEADVMVAFSELAGRSREDVARALIDRFHLPGTWEWLVELRLARYDAMLGDQDLLRRQALPAAIGLLRRVRQRGLRTGLTTMSDPAHAAGILAALGLTDAFEVVITPADVARGKPAPDMYQAATARMRCAPADCVALEDSVAGITAATSAGVPCIAVPTWLTRDAVHRAGLVTPDWIVDDPARLEPVFEAYATRKDARWTSE